jgi:2-keto-4-pentenoate hydratase/2-oxohepta-3-ene-1,7-dioic acid hydratase in catechol pathway
MRILRYLDEQLQEHFASVDSHGGAERLIGGLFSGFSPSGETANVRKILAPLAPAAILCTGLNYRKHAEETGSPLPKHPVLFMKTPSAVQNPGDPIEIPRRLASGKVDYEAELAIVIGKHAKNVSRENAMDYVLGYTCANDVSARDWQKEFGGSQWCRGKTFDTFAPLGPVILTPDEIPNPGELAIRTILNGTVMQDSNTSDLIFDIPTLIEFYSGSTTLHPGTVILTGTPSGVGMARTPPVWLQPGDTVTIEIESIGQLTNPVIDERLEAS